MDRLTERMEILAVGTPEMLCRPCVDCGLWTGRFCDYCLAKDRIPSEQWADNQPTPLCSRCDNKWDSCHVCRRVHFCTPPAHGAKLDGDVDVIYGAPVDTVTALHVNVNEDATQSGKPDGTAADSARVLPK